MVKKSILCVLILGTFASFIWAQQPLLKKLSATNYLPQNTFFLISSDNPLELLNRLGRETLIQKHQDFYNQMVSELTQAFGSNFLDPAVLTSIGAEPNGPVGFSFIETSPEKFAFFISVSDAAKMKETILTLADRMNTPINVEQIADATLIDLMDGSSNKVFFILRGNFIFFLGLGANYSHKDPEKRKLSSEEYAQEQLMLAREFAQITPENSLTNNPLYQKTLTSLAFGKDAAMYLNIASLTHNILEDLESDRNTSSNLEYYENRIKELEESIKNEPENEESYRQEIGYMEDSLSQEKEWIETSKQRRKEEAVMIRSILGGINSLVAGAELSTASVQVKAFLDLDDQSFFKHLFKNGNGHSLFLNTLAENPLFLVTGTTEIAPLIKSINDIFFRSAGMDLEAFKGMFKQEFAVDLDQEFIPLFTGETGFAFTGNIDMSQPENAFQSVNVTALLQLSDRVKGEEILNRLASHPQIASMLQKNEKTQMFSMPVPSWKDIHIGVIQNNFVVTSDLEFCERLRRGESDSFLNRIQNPELKSLLQTPSPAAIEIVDFSPIMATFLLAVSPSYDYADKIANQVTAEAFSSGEEAPYSEAYLAKKAEIEAIHLEIQALDKQVNEVSKASDVLYQERSKIESELAFQIFSQFGPIAIVINVEQNGIRFHSGLFVNTPSLAEATANIVDIAIELENTSNKFSGRLEKIWQQQDELYNRRNDIQTKQYQLEGELQDIRSRDIEEFYLKKE